MCRFSLLSLLVLLALSLPKSSLAAFHANVPTKDSHQPLQARQTRAKGAVTTCTAPRTFALTYDDGPYMYENDISNLLSSNGARGTFFINGFNFGCIYDEQLVEKLRHTFAQGHLIASHTWSHPDITTLTAAQFNLQLDLVEKAMKKILGVVPKFFRPPYGNINQEQLDILTKRGYQVILWSFDSGDSTGKAPSDSKKAYDALAKNFPTPQIALNHETSATTASDVTPHAVQVLKAAGYKLVTVSECLGLGNSPSAYYKSVGQPSARDSSWTCQGTPAPGQKL